MNPTLNIGIVETSLVWEDQRANLDHFERILQGNSDDLDLVILPEMFTTGFTMNPGNIPVLDSSLLVPILQEWSDRLNACIVGSVVYQEEDRYFNRLLAIQADSKVSSYDKIHLFSHAGEHNNYSAGDQKMVFEVADWRIRPLICYDLRFPRVAENREDTDLILYVANWPQARIHHWDRLLAARAIENQCYVAACNRIGTDGNGLDYNGHSGVWDWDGNPLEHKHSSEIKYYRIGKSTLEQYRSKYRFVQDRQYF